MSIKIDDDKTLQMLVDYCLSASQKEIEQIANIFQKQLPTNLSDRLIEIVDNMKNTEPAYFKPPKQKKEKQPTEKLEVEKIEWLGSVDKFSTLTYGKIAEVRKTIFEQTKDLNISDVDTSKVLQGLDKANDIIRTTNPFGLLITSIKNYRNTENEVMKSSMLRETFKSAGASLGQAKDAFVATNSVLKGLGIASDEVSQQMMGDITNMIGSASQLATGFATSNPVAIIQGSLGLFTSALSLFDGRTASALVGLWNSSSLDIRRLKEIAETQRTEPVPVEIYNPESNELQTLQGLTDEQLQQAA